MTALTSDFQLHAEQVEQYHAQGYIILESVFSEDEIAQMRREADRVLMLCINASLALGKRDPRLDVAIAEGAAEILDVRKVQPVNDLSDYLRSVSEDPRLVVPMRQLMNGYNPVLMEEKLNYKQKVRCPEYIARLAPKVGESRFFLHHDWGYYRQQGYPPETLSSAISMDATRPELGPIRVIPGSHQQDWPLQNPDPAAGLGIVQDGLFADNDRVEILAPAGSVMLFHSKLLHDSYPNRTHAPRRLMIYSHYPDSHSFEEDKRNRGGRLAGQEVENAYRALVERGEYADEFVIGV